MKIVEALSTVNNGITRDEISEITGIASSGDLIRKLTELENCGFIRKYVPFGYKQKNSLYQLIDNYTLFYYNFLRNNVHKHTAQIKAALGISGVYTEVNAWQCGKDEDKGITGSQIDLLIVRKDQVINDLWRRR